MNGLGDHFRSRQRADAEDDGLRVLATCGDEIGDAIAAELAQRAYKLRIRARRDRIRIPVHFIAAQFFALKWRAGSSIAARCVARDAR